MARETLLEIVRKNRRRSNAEKGDFNKTTYKAGDFPRDEPSMRAAIQLIKQTNIANRMRKTANFASGGERYL